MIHRGTSHVEHAARIVSGRRSRGAWNAQKHAGKGQQGTDHPAAFHGVIIPAPRSGRFASQAGQKRAVVMLRDMMRRAAKASRQMGRVLGDWTTASLLLVRAC